MFRRGNPFVHVGEELRGVSHLHAGLSLSWPSHVHIQLDLLKSCQLEFAVTVWRWEVKPTLFTVNHFFNHFINSKPLF